MISLLFLASTLYAADVPVLVELFTSEGCSSCPSADDLLAKLEKQQPVPGARILVLSEHVDYWNRLGWRDPFSSAALTARQESYAEALKQDGTYTPEAVVDGRTGFVGSNSHDALAAIREAAKFTKANIKLTLSAQGAGVSLAVDVTNIPVSKDADVIFALTENGLHSKVTNGENSGRTLSHTGVVRRMTVLGHVKNASYSTQTVIAIPRDWKRENLQAIVFVQDRKTKQILGVATTGEMTPQLSRLQ